MVVVEVRDTQFAGFAALVVEDLRQHGGFPMRPVNRSEVRPLIERIIARRAYDFACHIVGETTGMNDVSHVPDLTQWPEEVHDGSS